MKDFLYTPDMVDTPLSALSGGERGRLLLARALAKTSNVLVLDEPTNDLDLETLDLLQETLSDYSGTLILVSHDRDFLDRIVMAVIAAEGDGRWVEYAGGYSDMLAQRSTEIQGPVKPRLTKSAKSSSKRSKPVGGGQKRKLSFHEKHALESLPGEIESLKDTIAALHKRLSDPDLYGQDPQAYEQATSDLQTAEDRLNKAEEEWLELEILREELEQA